jgi:hypothetical protein
MLQVCCETRRHGEHEATKEELNVDFVIMKPLVALQAVVTGDVGYTTALGSTMRSAIRGLPLRVVNDDREEAAFLADHTAGNSFG